MEIYDKDIRPILYNKFASLKEFISDESSLIIDELSVVDGAARVDIAVVNGKLHGYEIKSERDTLDRLPDQIFFYNMVFDKMTIVISEKFLDKIKTIIPEWWGIYVISNNKNKIKLKIEKKAKINKYVQKDALLTLLWKDEMIEFLEKIEIKKGVRTKTKDVLTHLIIQNFSLKEIKDFTKNKLKSRNIQRAVLISQLCDD